MKFFIMISLLFLCFFAESKKPNVILQYKYVNYDKGYVRHLEKAGYQVIAVQSTKELIIVVDPKSGTSLGTFYGRPSVNFVNQICKKIDRKYIKSVVPALSKLNPELVHNL